MIRNLTRRLAYPLTVTAAVVSLVAGAILLAAHSPADDMLMYAVTRIVTAVVSAF